MAMVKVLLKPGHGIFEPDKEFQEVIESEGYTEVFSISARTNPVILKYVQRYSKEGILIGAKHYMYVRVVEVDTSRQWTIQEYDGSERIFYIDIKVVDEKLNYVELL